jgi:two-component system OmpR family response regulator
MRVLLVEDDPDLAEQIADVLRDENYAVDLAADGIEALEVGAAEPYDAVILDPGLPGMDGFTVLKRWRDQGLTMPVIVLTASRKEVSDMKEAARAGATNFLTKPVDMELLLDWVRGVVNSTGPNTSTPTLAEGDLRIDTQAMRVWFQDKPVKLTPTEYRILHYMFVNRQRPVSADELVKHNFDSASAKTSNEIPVYVSRLRDKLHRRMIQTEYGYGYRLVCDIG